MKKEIVITVPLYIFKQLSSIYDHPTPLENFAIEETCSRLLASLIKHKPSDKALHIILLYGKTEEEDVTNTEIDALFVETFQKMVNTHSDITISLAGDAFLAICQKTIAEAGYTFPINNIGYGNVRNLQLLLHVILGHEMQVNLDDDEIVTDQHFFDELAEIERLLEENPQVGGIGGLYVDDAGSADVLQNTKQERLETNIYKQKEYFLQGMIDRYEKEHWTTPASGVFGGLTYITQKMAEAVCYDPFIQRGEDIDYLLHAIYKKLYFSMDSKWTILHKPPGKALGAGHTPTLEKKRRDVMRFLYEKAKLEKLSEVFPVTPEEVCKILQTYPVQYFKASFEQLISQAEELYTKNELDAYMNQEIPDNLLKFVQFYNEWPDVVGCLQKNAEKIKGTLQKISG